MKPLPLSLLFAAATLPVLCVAQTTPKTLSEPIKITQNTTASQNANIFAVDLRRNPESGVCPVELLSADPITSARVLWAASDRQEMRSGFSLKYRYVSGKPVKSIEVRAEVRLKKNKYDLDAERHLLVLHIDQPISPSSKMLVTNLTFSGFLYGIEKVRLAAITYEDGSTWTTKPNDGCSIQGFSGMMAIGGPQ